MSVAFLDSTTENTITHKEMLYSSIRFVYFGLCDGEGRDRQSRVEVVRQDNESKLLIDHQTKQVIWFEPTLIMMPE